MFSMWLLACLALASAAPQFGRDFQDPFFSQGSVAFRNRDDLFGDEEFDTKRFWQELETEMQKFDQMLTEFYKHFPTATSKSGVQGNQYVVTQTLSDFEETDIKVKAREGVLMIQAVHKSDDGSQRSYLDLKTLPLNVNVNGTWTFENGVLRIVFPLIGKTEDVTPVDKEVTTEQPSIDEHSREEIGDHNENVENVDVGIENRDSEILTNVIPREPVEATTYAVDLRNEVEFVPVKY